VAIDNQDEGHNLSPPQFMLLRKSMSLWRSLRLSVGFLVVSSVLAGCAAHRSSAGKDNDSFAIYVADEKHVFDLVYSSIQEVFPTEQISTITTPTRGYITKFLAPPFHVDWFVQKVLVHRSSGLNEKSENVSGYWIEVSGSGSSFLQGQLKNQEVFNTIVAHLEQTTKKHVITNQERSAYLVPQENFYVRGSDTLEGEGARIVIKGKLESGVAKDRERQLRDLHKLRADKILTQEEYETAKRKVLEKY
jgi:hypothetical protein